METRGSRSTRTRPRAQDSLRRLHRRVVHVGLVPSRDIPGRWRRRCPSSHRQVSGADCDSVTSGGQYPPPQGQKAVVRALGLIGRGGPNISGVYVSDPGEDAFEFTNAGGGDAHGIEYAVADKAGSVVTGQVGHLRAGESSSVAVYAAVGAQEPIRCVWTCTDNRGRMHIWSYDGRHLRLHKDERLDATASLRRMYPDQT